jgi:hypothetical protein
MKRQKVESREYKIMLRNARFQGARELADRANDLFAELAAVVAPLAVATEGRFEDDGKRRRVTFWDTTRQHLNEAGYICRQRENPESGDREVTLKFRHYDRHVSEDRDMSVARGQRAKTKFEEDIKKPFVSLYSFSTTVPVEEEQPFRRIRDLVKLFPGIEAGIRRGTSDERIVLVNDFTARELVLKGAKIKLARTPKARADCALIVWYRGELESSPVAVEFSFRYCDKDEQYGGEVAARAFDVFAALQHDLGHWLSKATLTKTALVYGKGEGA